MTDSEFVIRFYHCSPYSRRGREGPYKEWKDIVIKNLGIETLS
jgi:hypothetical protein